MAETQQLAVPAESGKLVAQGQELIASARSLEVLDAAGFEFAAAVAQRLRGALARAKEVLDPFVRTADQAHKAAVAHRAAVLAPYQEAQRIVDQKAEAWEREQRRIADEAAAAVRREQERLEREARERAEAEQRRLLREAETLRLEEAATLADAGDHEAAERLLEEPVEAPVVAPEPVFVAAPPAAAQPPHVSGYGFRTVWDIVVEDPALVPEEYKVVDEAKVKRVVNAMQGKISIPGIKVCPPRRVAAGRAR